MRLSPHISLRTKQNVAAISPRHPTANCCHTKTTLYSPYCNCKSRPYRVRVVLHLDGHGTDIVPPRRGVWERQAADVTSGGAPHIRACHTHTCMKVRGVEGTGGAPKLSHPMLPQVRWVRAEPLCLCQQPQQPQKTHTHKAHTHTHTDTQTHRHTHALHSPHPTHNPFVQLLPKAMQPTTRPQSPVPHRYTDGPQVFWA
jgi:hypothetical protein